MSKSKVSISKSLGLLGDLLLVVAWATAIFFLSSQEVLPGFTVSLYDFLFKKGAHMFFYAVLYYLLLRTTRRHLPTANRQISYLLPLLLTFIYACLDELHQSTVPGRYPASRDVVYDMLGATTVLLHQLKLI
jgi:VanZ family protein